MSISGPRSSLASNGSARPSGWRSAAPLMWFGGAGLGLCLISIGVISLLAAADSTTSTFSEEKMGIAAHMWVAFGVDKKTAEALQTAASAIAAVVATAVSIAM